MSDKPDPEPPCPGAVLVTTLYSNRWEYQPWDRERYYVEVDYTDKQIIGARLMYLHRVWDLPREGNTA